MKIEVKKEGIILENTDLGFENEAVFNPACIREGDKVHMFYRAVRQGNYSSIGYCKLNGPLEVEHRNEKPVIIPQLKYETQGTEDPRIVKIDDQYYLTYSAYDNTNVSGALAVSTDLKNFEKKGLITPRMTYREYKHCIECCEDINKKYYYHYNIFKEHGLGPEVSKKLFVWDKNVMFFPRKINGKFAMIHRIHPGIQYLEFNSIDELNAEFWEKYMMCLTDHIIMDPELQHESSHIGGGCPPIETDEGWLFIYHSAEDTAQGFIYHAAAALLDLKDPRKEIARLPYPLISPELEWEKKGIVDNIIFPSGTAMFDDRLYIYYGAADKCIGAASLNLEDLLTELLKYKK